MNGNRTELIESVSSCVKDMQMSLAASAASLDERIRAARDELRRMCKEYKETKKLLDIMTKCYEEVDLL